MPRPEPKRSGGSFDASTMSPNLKPRRMPCFTQVLTRQPSGLDASGSAARTAPDDSASRSCAKAARAASRSADAPAATRALMSVSSMLVNGRWSLVISHSSLVIGHGPNDQ